MASITWTGAAGDGNYNNPANWSPQQVPGSLDSVTISVASATTINTANDAVQALTTSKFVTLAEGDNSSFTIGTASATTFSNAGTFALNGSYYGTNLIVGAAKVTLSGGGTIAMGDFGGNHIYGAAASDILNNVNNTIKGAGQLGNGTLTLANGAAGIINASATNTLYLNTGTISITNAGLLEATGTGGLEIQSSVNNGNTGHITAAGGNVYLGGPTITGGTLSSTGTSAIIDNGGATLDGRTSGVVNTGLLTITDNSSMGLLGTLTNSGTVALQSSYYGSNLNVGPSTGSPGTVTLTGGGKLTMSDHPGNHIQAGEAGDTFVNLNNTISGAGQIGAGTTLSITNSGTIDANATNTLYLNTLGTVTNTALIESTSGTNTGLIITSAVNDTGGGTISAAAGNVHLQGAVITGGLLSTGIGYAIIDDGGATLDGSTQTVTSIGSITITDNNTLNLLGTLNNQGTVALQSTYYGANLYITSATATLTGGGTITLTDHPSNRIYGSSAATVLDNVNNTITGAGQLGNGQLTLINGAAGVIDASGTNALVLGNGSAAVTNSGLIEATGTGGLTVSNVTVDDRSGGKLLANGGNIQLQGATILGGTLAVGAGGGSYIDNGGATLDGSSQAVTSLGTIGVVDNQALTVLGTLVNNGVVSLQSTYYGANFNVGPATGAVGTVTLSGGGVLSTTDHPSNRIQASQAGNTLINSNNLIEMAGQFGNGTTLNVINNSVINANLTNALVINTLGTFANNALIEATNTGGLTLNTRIDDSGGGTLLAAGGNISLAGGTIAGGIVNSSFGASVIVSGGGTLDGSTQTVTNLGNIGIVDNQVLDLAGTITNKGTITLNSAYYGANLVANSPTVTLTGGGTIDLTSVTTSRIYGAAGTTVLNNINNIIQGAGSLGYGQLTFINGAAGIVNANTAYELVLGSGSAAITNNGLMESTSGGGLGFSNVSVGGTGRIETAGGNVYLSGATITGGTLATTGVGTFIESSASTLDGTAHTVASQGTITITDNTSLTLTGAIANSGTIALQAGYYGGRVIVGGAGATLSGGGTISLNATQNNLIYGTTAASVLNNVDNTIAGSGQLGDGQLTLVNGGTINADSSYALAINLGGTGTNTASGQMIATSNGGLVFQNGTYTNNGLIQADSGSTVAFQTGAVLANDSATGTLTGGTYGAVSAGGTATASASFGNAAVITDNAALLLSGLGSSLSFGGVTIESSLKTIGTKGSLSVLGGRAYTTANRLTNSGTIALGGGTFTDKGLTSKGVVSGFGTLAGNLTDTGSIVATGGQLTLTGRADSIAGTISGTGTLAFSKGVDTLNAGTVLNVSNVALINAATLNLAASVSFGGTFDIAGKATLAGPGGFTNTGLFEQTGKGLGSIAAPFTNAGSISIGAGGTLAFSGGLANTGSILDNGVFTDSAALTGGSLAIGSGSSAATLGAGADTLSTLTMKGGTLNTNGGTLTVTNDYSNTAAGSGNSYNPFAGVTGTIDGQGTQLAVVGVNGTTITSVNGTLAITVTAGGTASFKIENTGPAGSALLRGALETTVNGGTINGTALSGNGVKAANFGPIAAGASSGIYTIAYSGGALNGEAIHLASDFANVAGLTIDIVAQGPTPPASSAIALPREHTQLANWLPAFHHV